MQVIFCKKTRKTGKCLQALLQDFESTRILNWGTTISGDINKPEAVKNASNKRKMRELFALAGVPCPKLYTIAEARIQSHAETLVGRPDKHSKGRNFFLCKNAREVERAITKGATHFMQFVQIEREFRLHVINGLIIKFVEKLGGTGSIRNYQNGWRFIQPTLVDKKPIRAAAKKAVKALALDFGAVDIGLSLGQLYVFEVNTAPGLTGTSLQQYCEHIKQYL